MQARSPSALAGRLDPIHSQYTPSDSGPGPHHDMHPGSHNKSDGQLAVQSFQTGSISPTEQDIRVQNHGYPYHSNISGISPIQKGLASVNRWSQSTASSDDLHYSSSQERIAGLGDYGMSRSAQSPTRSSECYQLPPTANPRSHNYSSSVASENVYDSAHSLPITRRLSNLLQSATMIDVTNSTGSQPRFTDNAIHSTSQPHGTENTEQGHTKGNSRENLATSYESRLSNQDDHTFQEDSVSPRQKLPSSGLKEQVRGKRQRAMSQKAMLSKALQKANTAVLLDNAANFEGAMEAYNDACELLQLVMLRSSGGDDEKLKLQEIRDTYMIRVNELERLDFSVQQGDSKALPQRPLSEESFGDVFQPFDEGEKPFDYNISRQEAPPLSHGMDFNRQRLLDPGRIPPRRQSLLPSPLDDRPSHTVAPPGTTSSTSNHGHSHSSSSWHKSSNEHFNELDRSLDGDLLFSFPNEDYEDGSPYPEQPQSTLVTAALKGAENESTSWLDTIDESGASSLSSSHSQASSLYLRRKDQPFSGTEAEFDAALDAAVEAAYDEGLEPVDEPPDNSHHDDIVSTARRNVELAKQRVREAELEAKVAMTKGRELRKAQQQTTFGYSTGSDLEYLDEEAEEEERLLEEMTKGYVMDDFEFDLQSKSALPRQSDSSGHSGTTWGSSAASHPGTGHLSPLVEDDLLPTKEAAENLDVLHHAAAPSTSMHTEEDPRIIPPLPKQVPTLGPSPGPGVRARRLSGQNLKELKIETNSNVMASATSRQPDPVSIISASLPQMTQADALQSNLPAPMANSTLSNLNRRNLSISSISEANLLTSTVMKPLPPDVCDTESSTLLSPVRPFGKVPSAPDIFGKAVSNMKSSRSTSISNLEPFTDSPTTPSSSTFPPLESQTATLASPPPVRPTPTALTFTPISQPTGGLYLFDSNIHSPTSPGSPNPSVLNAPLPLEPCPESFMLRPFWLMRCIYQSIANPRGGYLSKKLFLPRDVWHVKNVKIKAVEEKVFNCDLLTAALLKLALVDTYDADAVLEEMQLLEAVLDQVQTSLSKKLGSEVGVQSAMPLFKTASTTEDPATPSELLPSKSSAGQGKSYLTSWRKLRSKSSGHGTTAQLASVNYAGKDNLTLNSLPMTATPSAHRVKRDVTNLQFNGPNANYMGALARLCDAAQVLDQIAQQVEDPGLKHSSETLVGLELSTRHAAEFFGFYICRFALGDINLMLDKFIKRGSEWVLI